MLEDFFSICFTTSNAAADAPAELGKVDGDELALVALPMILPAIKPFA